MKRIQILSLALVLALAGCGKKGGGQVQKGPGKAPAATSNREAGEYYDKLAALRRQPEAAFVELTKGFGLGTAPTGQFVDPKTYLDQYAKSLQKARSDLKAVPVPEVTLASELRQAYDRSLQAEEATLGAWSQISQSVKGIGTTVDPNELLESIGRVKKERERIEAELVKVKDDFAKKHRLTGQ
jgi:hypothetical protein